MARKPYPSDLSDAQWDVVRAAMPPPKRGRTGRPRTHPLSSSIVMLSTVAIVVITHNLAIGVAVGVLLSGIFFAWKICQIFRVSSQIDAEGRVRTYQVEGQVFFASADEFVNAFDFQEALERVIIDVSRAHFWDISAVTALDRVVLKFRGEGATVELVGMNEASSTIVDRLGTGATTDVLDLAPGH